VPILVKGSLDDPSIQPDLEGVVRGVIEAPGDAVKGVIDGGGGAVKGLLDSVTGGGKSTAEEGASSGSPTQESSNPVEGAAKKLKGLFGTD